MELIETLRNITIREGFSTGRSLKEISDETGLSVAEVLQREVDLHRRILLRFMRLPIPL